LVEHGYLITVIVQVLDIGEAPLTYHSYSSGVRRRRDTGEARLTYHSYSSCVRHW